MTADQTQQDDRWMTEALSLAKQAGDLGEVPIGAIVVCEGQIVGRGYNRREIDRDPLAHAELAAINEAASHLQRWRLTGCTLYVTLEPCAMCAGALVNARVDRLVMGCLDPKAGAVTSLYQLCNDQRLNHRLQVASGIMAEPCAQILSDFFKNLRARRR